mgnify:CR=1 FL=1
MVSTAAAVSQPSIRRIWVSCCTNGPAGRSHALNGRKEKEGDERDGAHPEDADDDVNEAKQQQQTTRHSRSSRKRTLELDPQLCRTSPVNLGVTLLARHGAPLTPGICAVLIGTDERCCAGPP